MTENLNDSLVVSWANRAQSRLNDLIQQHEVAGTNLFSSLSDPTRLEELNASESKLRYRILQVGSELAETCTPDDRAEAIACFDALKSHMEAWGVDVEPFVRVKTKAIGLYFPLFAVANFFGS